MAFWVCFDHLGRLLAANLMCMAPVVGLWLSALAAAPMLPPGLLPPMLLALALLTPVLVAAGGAGMAAMAWEFIETRDGSLATFFAGLRCYGLRAGLLGLAYAFAAACLLTSAWYYLVRLGAVAPAAGYGLSALALWLGVLLALTAQCVLPALARRRMGMVGSVKLAVLLVLDNPVFFAGCGLCMALLFVLTLLLPPLLLCFSLAPAVVLQCSAYEILSRRYAAIEASGAIGAARRRVQVDFGDAKDDYLNRGFRDLVFPWKG